QLFGGWPKDVTVCYLQERSSVWSNNVNVLRKAKVVDLFRVAIEAAVAEGLTSSWPGGTQPGKPGWHALSPRRACSGGWQALPRRGGSGDPVGVDQLLHRATQQRLAAEGHAQGAELCRVDLVLRAAVEVGDRAGAAGPLLRDPGDLLLADVQVVAVERLPGDAPGVGAEQQIHRPGDVEGVDLLAAASRLDPLAAQHPADEFIPAAVLRRVGQSVDAGRPQRADGPALAQAVAVDERLQRRLVGAIVARRPRRVRLVQRPVVEDHFMDRAGREEDEARYAGLEGRLEQL